MTTAEQARAALTVRCRSKSGQTADLAVLDISAGGCMVEYRGWSASPGERVLMTLPGLSSQPGELVWIEDGKAGIVLEQPLHDAVFGQLQARMAG